jgi:phosphotriesterase-related protein
MILDRMIQTTRGAIDDAALGTTLMHEHVFTLDTEAAANAATDWDEDTGVADAIERLDELADAGVDTIVDLTVLGLGRDIPRIQRVAAGTRLQIVVATGIYAFHDLPSYFRYKKTDAIADYFVRDIEDGIAGTGVRAGILKCATDEAGPTRGVERILRAVARAHRRTGVPISTHTHAGSERGRDQQRIFAEEGVDLANVVIGHSGDTTDLDYLTALADAGSSLGMDRFGLDSILGFEQRVDTVAELCRRGRAGSVVLSHDAACYSDAFSGATLRQTAPNWHYLHITRDVLPALRERGVTEEQIRTMLVDNPRRILTPAAPY